MTLAHELDHALQDQYFGLDKLEAAVPGDGAALQALIEGDATRVENEYQQTLSTADQTLYSQESDVAASVAQGGADPATVPQVLQDLSAFAETLGPTFVDSIVADGGLSALNAAYGKPPVATAQVLDPVQYPIGWTPVAVPAPGIPTGDHTIDKAAPFGQFMLFELLGSLGYDRAWAAVQGWQGDDSVPYSDAGRTCVALDVQMANAAQTGALAAAGAQWTSVPGATVTASGTLVSLRSWRPGPAAAYGAEWAPPLLLELGRLSVG